MLAVGLPEEEALALIARHDRTVTISAFNGRVPLRSRVPRLSARGHGRELEAQGRSRDSLGSIIHFTIRSCDRPRRRWKLSSSTSNRCRPPSHSSAQ
jgi:hypothetical protein